MNIAYLASEVVPFAKTGGLADVAGALPLSLARRGHQVSVVMPLYKTVKEGGHPIWPTDMTVKVPMGSGEETARIHTAPMEKRGTYYFIEHARYFGSRDGLYGTPAGDYPDNCERFTFFNKVAAEFFARRGEPVDVLHCNDWQTALLPIYRKLWYGDTAAFGDTLSLFTIHNLAYQGIFPAAQYPLTGLPERLYKPHGGLEFYGKMSFLKGGLSFADTITTVSPGYAEEIQTEEFGAGLDGVLRGRSESLRGILNGIDTELWDPESDPLIPHRYSIEKRDGKKRCKKALQKECGFEEDPKIPLIGLISRLADQKGLDLVVGLLDRVRRKKLQFVLLGTGDEKYHQIFRSLQKKRGKRIRAYLCFDNELAHRIEAGADIFLMPSRFEPCGLNQMYSLRYGTVPIVRSTGGLADTVIDCNAGTMKSGTATGFCFDDYTVDALEKAVRRALDLFPNRRAWNRLVRAGMALDWSWERSAAEYEKLYEEARSGRPAPVA